MRKTQMQNVICGLVSEDDDDVNVAQAQHCYRNYATNWTKGSIPSRAQFSHNVQTGFETHLAACPIGNMSFP
jgi:hypothetical protein